MTKRYVGFIPPLVLLAIFLNAGSCLAAQADIGKRYGYIVDRQCADSVKQDSNAESFVANHTKDCSLMCKNKGYNLYSGGKWLALDAQGNKLALEVLQKSKSERGLYVEAIGAVKDNILAVKSMREISAL